MNKTDTVRPKVLIVDDNPENILLLKNILQDGYTLLFALKGEDALRMTQDESPDLILLDIVMPDMNGYQVCQKLKSTPLLADIPVIFISALEKVEEQVKGFEVGGVDYIAKPIVAPMVRARVNTHIELKQQRDVLKRLSSIDGLTGVANRRHFDEFLQLEWRRAVRSQSPIGLILADIDHFKEYNDRHGHLAGDDCLKQVAATLECTLKRPSDILARYGGEEFIAVLPDTELAGVRHVAATMLNAIRALLIPHPTSKTSAVVTVSFGLAYSLPQPTSNIMDFIAEADENLYQAKKQGRDRAVG